MKILSKIIKDSTTGIDGTTFDPARVLWIIGTFVFLALAIHTSYALAKPFDYQSFGIGFGAVLAGGGFAVNVKAATEPKEQPVKKENE